MKKMTKAPLSLMALAVLVALLLVSCGGVDTELSRADVDEIVREELADAPAPAQPEPGLTSADVEEAIRAALAEMPQPESGLSQEEVERIVEAAIASIPASQPGLTSADVEDAIGTALAALPQPEPGLTSDEAEKIARGVVASIPPKSAPADYTQFVVDEAIARYHADGLEATLAYYNSPDSVDAQWYVFIAYPEGEILSHYNADALGVHLEEMLDDGSFADTGKGIWVTHEDVNPATGEIEDKHFWLVEHDRLVFRSGWHHDESGN